MNLGYILLCISYPLYAMSHTGDKVVVSSAVLAAIGVIETEQPEVPNVSVKLADIEVSGKPSSALE